MSWREGGRKLSDATTGECQLGVLNDRPFEWRNGRRGVEFMDIESVGSSRELEDVVDLGRCAGKECGGLHGCHKDRKGQGALVNRPTTLQLGDGARSHLLACLGLCKDCESGGGVRLSRTGGGRRVVIG